MSESEAPKQNGKASGVLSILAGSSDRLVQLGTLLLVGVSGLGNFLQNENLSRAQLEDRERAVRQINQMYQRIDDFERRQSQNIKSQNDLLESNNMQLKNQGELLDGQHQMLKILKEGQTQFLQRQQRQMPQPQPPEF